METAAAGTGEALVEAEEAAAAAAAEQVRHSWEWREGRLLAYELALQRLLADSRRAAVASPASPPPPPRDPVDAAGGAAPVASPARGGRGGGGGSPAPSPVALRATAFQFVSHADLAGAARACRRHSVDSSASGATPSPRPRTLAARRSSTSPRQPPRSALAGASPSAAASALPLRDEGPPAPLPAEPLLDELARYDATYGHLFADVAGDADGAEASADAATASPFEAAPLRAPRAPGAALFADERAARAESAPVDCAWCLLERRLRTLQLAPFSLVRRHLLLHAAACACDTQWELRRMADQVLPLAVQVCAARRTLRSPRCLSRVLCRFSSSLDSPRNRVVRAQACLLLDPHAVVALWTHGLGAAASPAVHALALLGLKHALRALPALAAAASLVWPLPLLGGVDGADAAGAKQVHEAVAAVRASLPAVTGRLCAHFLAPEAPAGSSGADRLSSLAAEVLALVVADHTPPLPPPALARDGRSDVEARGGDPVDVDAVSDRGPLGRLEWRLRAVHELTSARTPVPTERGSSERPPQRQPSGADRAAAAVLQRWFLASTHALWPALVARAPPVRALSLAALQLAAAAQHELPAARGSALEAALGALAPPLAVLRAAAPLSPVPAGRVSSPNSAAPASPAAAAAMCAACASLSASLCALVAAPALELALLRRALAALAALCELFFDLRFAPAALRALVLRLERANGGRALAAPSPPPDAADAAAASSVEGVLSATEGAPVGRTPLADASVATGAGAAPRPVRLAGHASAPPAAAAARGPADAVSPAAAAVPGAGTDALERHRAAKQRLSRSAARVFCSVSLCVFCACLCQSSFCM